MSFESDGGTVDNCDLAGKTSKSFGLLGCFFNLSDFF